MWYWVKYSASRIWPSWVNALLILSWCRPCQVVCFRSSLWVLLDQRIENDVSYLCMHKAILNLVVSGSWTRLISRLCQIPSWPCRRNDYIWWTIFNHLVCPINIIRPWCRVMVEILSRLGAPNTDIRWVRALYLICARTNMNLLDYRRGFCNMEYWYIYLWLD